MALLTTLGLIGGATGSVMNFIGGSKASADAKRKLDNMEFQGLGENAAAALSPSLALEQQALDSIQLDKERMADVLMAGGDAASMMSMMTASEESTGKKEQGLYGTMSNKMFEADKIRVQDDQMRRNMQEQRDMSMVQGLQAQIAAGEQMKGDAITNFSKTAMTAGIGQETANAEAGFDPMGMFDFLMKKPKKNASDRRLKNNIKLIGKSKSGLNIYSFKYIDKKFGEGTYQGVMSDEIPTDAVTKHKDGFDRVDYSKIDVKFQLI